MRSPRLVFVAFVALLVGLGVPSLHQKVTAAPAVSVTGSFNVIYGDPEPGSKLPGRTHYTLSNDTGRWKLIISDAVLGASGGALALKGKTVVVTGEEEGPNKIVVQSISLAGGAGATPQGAEALVSGSKNYATLLCKFNDIATEQQPVGFFTTLMGMTKPGLNHYWREVSYENINLDGSAEFDWQTMASPRADYFDADGDADLDKLAADCLAAHSFDLTPWFGANYVFNGNLDCCAWGGGYGGKAATWMPPWAWTGRVFGHESGHSIGLDHSADQYGNEYGNRWDVMGSGTQTHVNGFHKALQEWIPAAEIYTASGAINQQIRLVHLAIPPDDFGENLSDYMMVKIPIPGGDDYYTLEARKKVGYDGSPGSIPFEGVIIHLVDPTSDSASMSPGSASEIVDGTNNGNAADDGAAWVPGEMFVDEANGITVAVTSEYDDGWVISINPNTDVAVTKTATPNPAVAGELLTYNITVSNLGPGPATGVVVKDTLPAFTTYDENTLGPGACVAVGQVVTCTLPGALLANTSKTFGITVKVSAAIPVTNGTTTITNVVNVVAAQDDDPTSTNNNFSLTTLVVTRADLVLTKECKPDQPNKQPAGTPTYCEIYVDNIGPSDAANVVITDRIISTTPITITSITTIGAGLSCPAGPIGPTSDTTITCTDAVLPVGTRDTIRVNFVANATGDVDDIASVSSTTPDPDAGNNLDRGRVSFASSSDLSLTKAAAATVIAGTNLTYNLSVTNGGPSPAANVVLRDVLPAFVNVVSVTPSAGSCQAGYVPGDPTKPLTCNFGTLAVSGSATLMVVVKVNSDVPKGTVLANNADVSSDSADPNNSNNVASRNTTVDTNADLALVKNSDAEIYKPSTVVTYSVNVTNNGPSKALNVVVTDNLPDLKAAIYQSDTGGCVLSTPKTLKCNLGDMAVGDSKTFFIYVLVKGSKGVISNTASVGSATADAVAGNNSSTKNVTIGK